MSSSYTLEHKHDIEQGEAPPPDAEGERLKTSHPKAHHHHHHRKHHHHHKHHYSHQQPQIRIDEMQPAHDKRIPSIDTSNEARNGQDLSKVDDDIVKDLSYLLSVPKQEEHHHDNDRHDPKDCHEDSKEYCDNKKPSFKVQESETQEKNAQGVNLDEMSVDSALEEQEQRAASFGPNFQPQKPRPSHPGAIRVHGSGADSTVGDEDELTVTSPSTDLERGIAGGNETGLVVAKKVNDGEEPVLLTATKYDPAAKPPLYQSRRFQLYTVAIVVLLLIAIAVVLAVVLPRDDEDPDDPGAPTAPPMTLRERTFREQFALEVGDAVNVEGSPQDRAADWIMFEDPLGLSPNASHLMQRYQMALLYFVTTNNKRSPWNSCNPPRENETDECLYIANEFDDAGNLNATRWLSGMHECEWIGVFCDSGENIISLQVSNQNITSTLPTEISSLPYLQAISFSTNEFSGTIPKEYADMKQLVSLELHYNMLTGTVPDVYWQANALQNLNVGNNFLIGTISTHVGTMNQLKGLHLFENNFSGTIPTEIGNAHNLSYVRLFENGLVGEIPTETGKLAELKEFWVSENGLEGRIPSELGLISDMEFLDVDQNQLSGTIPEELYNLTQLLGFAVDKNRLTGTISPNIGQLSNVEYFQVSTNDLTGTIPLEVRNLDRAVALWFHKTRLWGTMPTVLCRYRQDALVILQADCNPPETPPVSCQCCSHCCDRDTGICLAET